MSAQRDADLPIRHVFLQNNILMKLIYYDNFLFISILEMFYFMCLGRQIQIILLYTTIHLFILKIFDFKLLHI